MKIDLEFYASISSLPETHIKFLEQTKQLVFTPKFLQSFELGNPKIEFQYIFVTKGVELAGFTCTQQIKIGLNAYTENVSFPYSIRQPLNHILNRIELHVLFSGNIFLSHSYGIFCKYKEDLNEVYDTILSALIQSKAPFSSSKHVVIKDFIRGSEMDSLPTFKTNKFTRLILEPNMIIDVKEHWKKFDDYKQDLKSKYRVKINKADSSSAVLKVNHLNEIELEIALPRLQELYENTIKNADFNAHILNFNTYRQLKNSFQDEFIIQTYSYNKKIVGFLTAMLHQDSLTAHFIGIDYSLNKQLAIYPRILNDYIRLGIKHGVKKINLGRTASEIKTTIGAEPMSLVCYCKHTHPILNYVLQPLIKQIRPKPFKHHQPFKQKNPQESRLKKITTINL